MSITIHRQWLEQKFYDLHTGDLPEIYTMSDDDLDDMTDELKALQKRYIPERIDQYTSVDTNAYMDEMQDIVEKYLTNQSHTNMV